MSSRSNNEYLLYGVLSGKVKCIVDDEVVYIVPATPIQHVFSQEIYDEALRGCQLDGILSETEMLFQMVDANMWSIEKAKRLEELPKLIEDFKVELYNAFVGFGDRERIRKLLFSCKTEMVRLLTEKTQYFDASCEGLATLARSTYLACACSQDRRGNYRWDEEEIDEVPQSVASQLLTQYSQNVVPDEVIRCLSRKEPWRSMWTSAKAAASPIFPGPSIFLSAEQRSLLSWSRLYDNIYEHSDCPCDEVIDDDDMLDGWLTIQHRNRVKEKSQAMVEKGIGAAGRGSEVFIVAQNPADITRIHGMNDTQSRVAKRQKFNLVAKKGEVSEENLPESQLKLRALAISEQGRN